MITLERQVILAVIKIVFSSESTKVNRQWESNEFSQQFPFICHLEHKLVPVGFRGFEKSSQLFSQIIDPKA